MVVTPSAKRDSSRRNADSSSSASDGCAGGAHGGHDAAAGLGDVGIGGAIEALLEFSGAVAAVNQMGVAIDEAGGEEPATAIDRIAFGSVGSYRFYDAVFNRTAPFSIRP